jgi:hypothetical protein
MLMLLLYIPLIILIQYNIFCVKSLFGVMIPLIQYSKRFWKRFGVIKDQRLSIYIRNRKLLLVILSMLFLLNFFLLLELLLFFFIIKMTIYWIIVMCSPIFFVNLVNLLSNLFFHFFFMVFFVNVCYNIKIFFVIVVKSFFPLYR